MEEVLALDASLFHVPPGWKVGLTWKGDSRFRVAREAGLDVLVAFRTAARSTLGHLSLCGACHWDIFVHTTDCHVGFLHTVLIIDRRDVFRAARV